MIEAVGAWGVRWVGELGDRDLDPKLLLWDMHRNVVAEAVPDGRTVVGFHFPDAERGRRDWWLLIEPEETDVCDSDPGLDVAVRVDASLRALVAVWLGDRSWTDALRAGDVAVHGPADLRRGFPGWFRLSPFAAVPRVEPVPDARSPTVDTLRSRRGRPGAGPVRRPPACRARLAPAAGRPSGPPRRRPSGYGVRRAPARRRPGGAGRRTRSRR